MSATASSRSLLRWRVPQKAEAIPTTSDERLSHVGPTALSAPLDGLLDCCAIPSHRATRQEHGTLWHVDRDDDGRHCRWRAPLRERDCALVGVAFPFCRV